jgi:hypothetical protein
MNPVLAGPPEASRLPALKMLSRERPGGEVGQERLYKES